MTGKLIKTYAFVLSAVGLNSILTCTTNADITFQTFVHSGQTAAGTGPGIIFHGFSDVTINGNGEVAFSATIAGPGIDTTNDKGVWSGVADNLRLVAHSGDVPPGIDDDSLFKNFYYLNLNDEGQVCFSAELAGPNIDITNNRGIWSEGLGSLRKILRNWDAAPDPDSDWITSRFLFPAFSESGQVATLLTFYQPGYSAKDGIWLQNGVNGHIIALEDEHAPGLDQDVVFQVFDYDSDPALNASGQIAFFAMTGKTYADRTGGIWSNRSGSLAAIVLPGDAAPGLGPGATFSSFDSPWIDEAGQVQFNAYFSGPGVDSTNHYGIWSEFGGSLHLHLRTVDHAPGTPDGVVFRYIPLTSPLNRDGHLAILGDLSGPGVGETNEYGIWSDTSGSLSLIARAGDPAPGVGQDVVFGELDYDDDFFNLVPVNPFHQFRINDSGQVVFFCNLIGEGIDSTNDIGLWAMDLDQQLKLIARIGDTFDVDDDPLTEDLRTIRYISQNIQLGNNGKLTLHLGFTDGSEGIFVATIPEPGTVALFVVGVGWMSRQRRC